MILKVKAQKKENQDSFSLILEKPDGFNFYPGQYLTIKYQKLQREFTIASSSTENFLMITTKFGISLLKKHLANLKPGDFIESDHPAGTYTLDTSSPAVMICGGIGITPARSMIKYAADQGLKIPITLIYSNSNENFIFKKELNEWQKQYPNLTIHYIVTEKEGRLTNEKLSSILHTTYYILPIYYLAGPPKMVDEFEEILLKLGVDSTSIRTDRFDGY